MRCLRTSQESASALDHPLHDRGGESKNSDAETSQCAGCRRELVLNIDGEVARRPIADEIKQGQ
jgi:hypothetical protein